MSHLSEIIGSGLEKSCQWKKVCLLFGRGNKWSHLPSQKENLPLLAICKSLLSLGQFYYFLHNYGVLPCSEQSPVHKYCASNYKDAWRLSWARQNGTQPSGVGLPSSGVGPESWRPVQWCSKTWHCGSFSFFFPFSEPALLLIDTKQRRFIFLHLSLFI